MEINKVLPVTTSLPGVPTLIDPTVSKVQKAVMIVFATVTAIPVVVVTITLVCDGMYNAYHYISFYFQIPGGSSEKKPVLVRESFGSGGGGGGGFSSGKTIKASPTLQLQHPISLDLPKPVPKTALGKSAGGKGRDAPKQDESTGKQPLSPAQLQTGNTSTQFLPPVGERNDGSILPPPLPKTTSEGSALTSNEEQQRPSRPLVVHQLPPHNLNGLVTHGDEEPLRPVQQENRTLVVRHRSPTVGRLQRQFPSIMRVFGDPFPTQWPSIFPWAFTGLRFQNGSIALFPEQIYPDPDLILRQHQPIISQRTQRDLVHLPKPQQRLQLIAPGEPLVEEDPSLIQGAVSTQQRERPGDLSERRSNQSRDITHLLRQWEAVRDTVSPESRFQITFNGYSVTASAAQIQQYLDLFSIAQHPLVIRGNLGQVSSMSLIPRPWPMVGEEDLTASFRQECQEWEMIDPTYSAPVVLDEDIRPWLGYLRVSGNQRNEEKYSIALYHIGTSLRSKFPTLDERWKKLSVRSPVSMLLHSLLVSNGTCVGTRYADLHYYLRQSLLDYSEETQGMRDVLLHISHSKYVEMAMYPFLEDYLSEVLVACKFEMAPLTFSTLAASAREANHKLKIVPFLYQQRGIAKDWSKLLGTVGLWFDPSAGSNVSWVHSLQITADGKIVYVLRHGTPTQDPGVGGVLLREVGNLTSYVPLVGRMFCASTWASVVPEFEAHLAADTTKQTLYVNHQEYDASGHETSHGEGDRSQAIRELEGRHRNFHFLALPFDGPLWKKRSAPRKVGELCQFLCDSLIKQQNGFCLPKAMQNVDRNHIMAILAQIHQLYFSGQEFASVKEEKAFIMLFYSELKDYAKIVLLIDYIVSACKDNKDRGNASTTVDMGKNMVKLGQEEDPQRLKEIFFSVLGPFIIKNEEIIGSRLEFALAVLEHLASLPPQQRKAIRETPSVSGFKLARQVVPKEYTVEEKV